MSPFRSEPRTPGVKAADCPAVADLLDFALGNLSPDDRKRVETHVTGSGCDHCRSWINKLTGEPTASFPPPRSQPPIDSAEWQCKAFSDLNDRFKRLEG